MLCIFTSSLTLKQTKMTQTIEQMIEALKSINFFIGGLTNEGIIFYYNKMKNSGKL